MSDKMSHVSEIRTICEVHREMYDVVESLPDDKNKILLKEKIEDAFVMAKKMNHKLRQYKFNYDDDWWEKEKQEAIASKRELRKGRDK